MVQIKDGQAVGVSAHERRVEVYVSEEKQGFQSRNRLTMAPRLQIFGDLPRDFGRI